MKDIDAPDYSESSRKFRIVVNLFFGISFAVWLNQPLIDFPWFVKAFFTCLMCVHFSLLTLNSFRGVGVKTRK